ncbi:hypothetical protein PR048_017263 [Dryococelus australis]|uniref:Uncharacterized protein n=1 Tax=Dryococelus australis TaxID=614101 RepID=A0ABQ9H930_9NEOP|nr:hypothetical protein PR048_017263 [Dryococelus australis]
MLAYARVSRVAVLSRRGSVVSEARGSRSCCVLPDVRQMRRPKCENMCSRPSTRERYRQEKGKSPLASEVVLRGTKTQLAYRMFSVVVATRIRYTSAELTGMYLVYGDVAERHTARTRPQYVSQEAGTTFLHLAVAGQRLRGAGTVAKRKHDYARGRRLRTT